MPNTEALLIQISMEIEKDRVKELKISKIDLVYAYSEMKLWDEARRQCVLALTEGNTSGYYRPKKDSTD